MISPIPRAEDIMEEKRNDRVIQKACLAFVLVEVAKRK